MSTSPLIFDWNAQREYNWTTPDGLELIKNRLSSFSNAAFIPHDFQLKCTSLILNGTDVVCVTATGDGKSALIYMPVMVQRSGISLVVSPTNFLECDMEASFKKKGLSAVAINSETLAAAEHCRPKRNLWLEARKGQHQVIFMGPETMRTSQYDEFIKTPDIRNRLIQFTVDELHLLNEWGMDFRTSYQEVSTMRARLPNHTVFVGLSASIEPGQQFNSCIRAMGIQTQKYHLEKRDCERKNVTLVFRPIKYASSTYEFRDLDWLIPPTFSQASDVPKRVVFCQSIELGHRLVIYLRSLLPSHLRTSSHKLIRHHHSLNCPDCKAEGLNSLYLKSTQRDCAVHVSTDVLSVGVDIPDLPEVILFGGITSLSVLIQRTGRPAREIGSLGKAIVYVKKTDIESARSYILSEEGSSDDRLLTKKDPQSHVASPEEMEVDTANDGDRLGDPGADGDDPDEGGSNELTEQITVSDSKAPVKQGKKTSPCICAAYRLVVGAFIRHRCLIRQINIIYTNPGTEGDCAHCSSCCGDVIPEPRTKTTTLAMPPPPLPPSVPTSVNSPPPPIAMAASKIPAYMKLKVKDISDLSIYLKKSVQKMRWSADQRREDTLLVSIDVFLPPTILKNITTDFLHIQTPDILKARLATWKYWREYGSLMWDIVHERVEKLSETIRQQHQKSLEKQRDARLHKALTNLGLDTVKRVVLRLPTTTPDIPVPVPPPTTNALTTEGPPPSVLHKHKRTNSDKENIQPAESSKRPKRLTNLPKRYF